MKKFANVFYKSGLLFKTILVLLSMALTTFIMYATYSVIFFLVTVFHEGVIFVSSLLGVLLVLVSVTKYPPRKENYNDL